LGINHFVIGTGSLTDFAGFFNAVITIRGAFSGAVRGRHHYPGKNDSPEISGTRERELFTERLQSINSEGDIPAEYKGTPIGLLAQYHNLGKAHASYATAQMLIGMCMDNRKSLSIPDNFAYILRAGGANLRYSEFKVSHAIAVGGVQNIALIGHNQCGMVNLVARKEQFIQGLIDRGGWEPQLAEEQFMHFSPMFEIVNEIDFVLSEVKRLRNRYPKVKVAAMLYKVEDGRLYWIKES